MTRIFDDEGLDALLHLVERAPQGVGEYQLIQQLREGGRHAIPPRLSDPLDLFHTHFRVFNGLYRLRDRLWQLGRGTLSIDPISIRLEPYRRAQPGLAREDGLRSYYLDESHLELTTVAEVEAMLASGYSKMTVSEDDRHRALATLGLPQGVDLNTIVHRYRRLVSRHHPDRGGDTARVQALNEAMEILRRLHR